jgi:hypothetical protein
MEVLQDLANRLTIPGLPGWTGLLAVLILVLVGLAYLLMPFIVFGVKGRLEALEIQLDEIQAELRSIAMRMTDQPRHVSASDHYLDLPSPRRAEPSELRATPPVPPPAARPEPRLDWPNSARR